MGATTIWERWDSMLPDGSINPGEMTSFNHYAFGAVASWLHSTVAGLSADTPGYQRIRIAPRPRPPLTDAGATHETPYGTAAVDWRLDGATLVVDVLIPPGTVGAIIDLENHPPEERGPGRHVIRVPYPEPAHSRFESRVTGPASVRGMRGRRGIVIKERHPISARSPSSEGQQ